MNIFFCKKFIPKLKVKMKDFNKLIPAKRLIPNLKVNSCTIG